MNKYYIFLFFIVSNLAGLAQINPNQPNILLIIADDLGVDALNGFHQNSFMPTTPTLDGLRQNGLTFKNVWAAPRCSPTRAAIMSGKFGSKTGVLRSPGNLDTVHTSIFKALDLATNSAYANALIGKWHLTDDSNFGHPEEHGIQHFEGVFGAAVSDYFSWSKRKTDGTFTTINEYVTSHITDNAIDWINNQTQPWFLWLAHAAPHTPYHIPPDSLKYLGGVGTNKRKYYAAIEAMDTEIGRLLDNMPSNQLNNTIIIFIGDNGTPAQVNTNYTSGKGQVFEGGVRVPMIVSGANVGRINEVENKMIHAVDIYATILELIGSDLDGGIHNSFSFLDQLNIQSAPNRPFNYSEITGNDQDGFCIRNDQYKYIELLTGEKYFYEISIDSFETNNLYNSLNAAQSLVLEAFKNEVIQIKEDYSCNDMILNGGEVSQDYGGAFCPNVAYSQSSCNADSLIICNDLNLDTFAFASNYLIDAYNIFSDTAILKAGNFVCLDPGFAFEGNFLEIEIANCFKTGIGSLNCSNDSSLNFTNIGCSVTSSIASEYTETVNGSIRTILSNNWPNHIYGISNNTPQPMPNQTFDMLAYPTLATTSTSILQETGQPKYFFGVAVNGVKIAPAPATPFIFENSNTGEYNWDWVFEPTNNQGAGQALVGLDCNSAHTGPQGYHYHGNMFEYAETFQAGLSTTSSPPSSAIQIGWAADGFPILYRFGPDGQGGLIELQPSYQLKYGNRQGDGISAPCGRYNGKYTNDYEFIECSGALDACNGIERQVTLPTSLGNQTFDYFYVVTESFPQIGRCFKGFPNSSFD